MGKTPNTHARDAEVIVRVMERGLKAVPCFLSVLFQSK